MWDLTPFKKHSGQLLSSGVLRATLLVSDYQGYVMNSWGMVLLWYPITGFFSVPLFWGEMRKRPKSFWKMWLCPHLVSNH